jgi:hypothetical protein
VTEELIAAIKPLRADLAKQHAEVVQRLDAILAVLPPPPSPDLNPLGALMSARTHYRTERMLADPMSERIATTEGFYWVILGHNSPEIAYWERGGLAGDPKLWQPEAVTVVSDRLVFKPKLVPVA